MGGNPVGFLAAFLSFHTVGTKERHMEWVGTCEADPILRQRWRKHVSNSEDGRALLAKELHPHRLAEADYVDGVEP